VLVPGTPAPAGYAKVGTTNVTIRTLAGANVTAALDVYVKE
jgi:hypothetical protein